MTLDQINTVLDTWFAQHVQPAQQKLHDYIATAFTKKEAERHSDNLQNMHVGTGALAQLKMELLLAAATPVRSEFRLTPELLAQVDFTLTPEQKYHNIKTDIYCNSHRRRKVILYPGGWRGFELVEDLVGNGFNQIFRGAVDSEEEFFLVLRFVQWLDHEGKLRGVDYIKQLPPLGE